ncbi:MAG: hypothetical protein WBB98_17670 [Xanthobacteraceae bacterium]
MTVSDPNFSMYSTVLFMDSMVALEARPLKELPWREIDPAGPILILVVPQVNAEIDKRKRDGRLGKRAREFNRIISPAAETASPSRIHEGPPAVDIAIAACDRINWDLLDDLDPESGDARVVAQVLHTRGVPSATRLLFSHDVNPIAMAARHGLRTRKMPEHWLMDLEPSSTDKEMQKLRARVKELEASEPQIKTSVSFDPPDLPTLFDITPLTSDQQHEMRYRILRENPAVRQDNQLYGALFSGKDYTYDERYEAYRDVVIPKHTSEFHNRVETQFNQIPFVFIIENNGKVQAENLIVTLTAIGGTIHNRFRVYPLSGPRAPKPKSTPLIAPLRMPKFPEAIDPHAMRYVSRKAGTTIELRCADYRQGQSYQLNGIALIDARSTSPFRLNTHVTASNMRGQYSSGFERDFLVQKAKPEDLIDLEQFKLIVAYPMKKRFLEAVEARETEWFQFLGRGDDE